MKIKIYQINMERDDEGCAFMGMDFLNRKLGVDHPASEIYEQVFDGEIDGKSPEDVFAKFNWDHPENYRGRSLSVSDVVEIIDGAEVEPGFYFCDSIGFKKVAFDTSRVTVKEDKLLYEGREVDLTQLEEDLLKDYKADSSTVELLDDHAIKAVYDEVSALLQKLSIPFTEGK